MPQDTDNASPILRLFQVKTKKGAVEELIGKFATTSADVVRNEPGNEGYFFGRGVELDEDVVVFASVWRDLDAVKQRFRELLVEDSGKGGNSYVDTLCNIHTQIRSPRSFRS